MLFYDIRNVIKAHMGKLDFFVECLEPFIKVN